MAGLTLNNQTIEKYFRYLKKLDNRSKKKLIRKLNETIEAEKPEPPDIASLFGAWEDERSSDEIIKEIRESRIENQNVQKFE